MREASVESYLRDLIVQRDGLCIKLSPAAYVGIPDRLVLLPGGRVMAVELKAPGKRPTELQLRVHQELRSLGLPVVVIDGRCGVDALIRGDL